MLAGGHPEAALLGAAASRVEHRRRRLVDEQLGRAQQLRAHQPPQRLDLGGGVTHPAGQHRTVDRDALARQDLRLAIKRGVVGVFRHQHVGDQLLGRQAALDQPRRRHGSSPWAEGPRRLDHPLLALAAGVFRPAGDDDLVLRRDHVEPLRAVFADRSHRLAATGTSSVRGLDDDLDPRQMLGQRAAHTPAFLGPGALQRRIGLLLLRFGFGDGLFEVLQRKMELVGIEVTIRREPPCVEAAIGSRLEASVQVTVLASVQETVRWRESR